MNVEKKLILNRFKPRWYQIPPLRALETGNKRRILLVWARRMGKDIFALNAAIRQLVQRVGTVYYIFPTFTQARRSLWDAIDIQGRKILDYYIPDELIKAKNSSEMKITFLNGSVLQFLGSENYDRLRGTNPFAVVFSEYATQNPMAYSTIRPILAANNGLAIFCSCVSPNTIVITNNGMKRIKDISSSRKEYTTLNKPIYGLNGFHNATDFYYGGKQKTLKIKLKSGFEIECTKIHKLWNGTKWIKSADLKIGDCLPIQYGQNIFGLGLCFNKFKHKEHGLSCWKIEDRIQDKDFFYLLGLIHADGSYDKYKVTITNKKDPEIIEFLHDNRFVTFKDGIHHNFNSRTFVLFLEYLGFKHGAKNKTFPDKLFECNKEQLRFFLQGLFDGDGCSSKSKGSIHFASTCFEFIRDLQVILLNFGIASSFRKHEQKPTKLVKKESILYLLEISGYFSHIFYEEIGFRLERKQFNKCKLTNRNKEESGNIYPVDISKLKHKLPKNIVTNPSKMSRIMIKSMAERYNDPYLKSLLDEKYYYSEVISIQDSDSEVFDFVIPDTHSFFSNGFISHNTPFGKNHFWDLYQIAQNSSDWYCDIKTVDDAQHIPQHEIDTLRATGEMSEEMIQQEFYVNFNKGTEGSYYAKIINQLRLDNRISTVPYESAFPVHTAWDIGFTDATAIIFFQIIGQSVHLIDYYENHNLAMEAYVKVVLNKPYTYGKHIGPHDIVNKNSSNGLSPMMIASQLGLQFTKGLDRGSTGSGLDRWGGIQIVKSKLPTFWIDEPKCAKLLKALDNYSKKYNTKTMDFDDAPSHNFASHGSDALRVLCTSLSLAKGGNSPEELNKRYQRAMYGTGSAPQFYRKWNE